MAISGGDGSIILDTKVDTKGLNSGLNSMKGAITKIGGLLAAAFSVKALINFANESKNLYKIQMENEVKLATVMRQRMKATDDEIKSMLELASAQQQIGIIGDEVQLAGLQQIATFATQKETIETLLPAMNNLIAQQYGYEASTESARNAANLMGKVLQGQTGALTRVGITFSAAEEQMLKTGNEMERAAVLAKVITNNVGQMNTALAQTDVGRQQQLANTFGDIKEQFGAAFTQLAVLLLPALRTLANLLAFIASIARAAAQGIANLFGAKTTDNSSRLANNMQTISGGASSAADNMGKVADATKKAGKEAKKAGKEAKKSLAAFDELNILSSGASGGDAGAGAGKGAGGIEAAIGGGEIGTGFDFGIQDKIAEIDASMAMIMGIIGASLAALGLYFLFLGNIPWGVGLIIAGIAVFGVSAFALAGQEDVSQNAANALSALMGIVGGALVALGIMLIYLGSVAWGVGFIIAGAASLGVGAKAIKDFDTNKVENVIMMIEGIAAGALLALGIILLVFNGANPLSIGLIVAGAGLLAITAAQIMAGQAESDVAKTIHTITTIASAAFLALGIILVVAGVSLPLGIGLIVAGAAGLAAELTLNWDEMVNRVSTFLKENQGLIVGISLALLVLGIILCCTGVALPLGIGLIVVGAAGLAAEVDLNWDTIKEKTETAFNEVINWVKTWGLLVLGIILTISGLAMPLGIALMIAGGANLAEAQDPLWTAIVDKVKATWDAIKIFWDTHIAKWFTKKHWAGLAKNMMNGLIEKIEAGLNRILTKFHNANLGKAIDFIAGGLGFDIPQSITIPPLARGAVLPPNQPFLAMVGDQKHGTNIEAPLDTIVEAMNIALQNNGAGQTTKEEHYYLGETELMSIIYKLVKGGERLQGKSLISGGAY